MSAVSRVQGMQRVGWGQGGGWKVGSGHLLRGASTPLPNQGSKSEKKVVTLGRGWEIQLSITGSELLSNGCNKNYSSAIELQILWCLFIKGKSKNENSQCHRPCSFGKVHLRVGLEKDELERFWKWETKDYVFTNVHVLLLSFTILLHNAAMH